MFHVPHSITVLTEHIIPFIAIALTYWYSVSVIWRFFYKVSEPSIRHFSAFTHYLVYAQVATYRKAVFCAIFIYAN